MAAIMISVNGINCENLSCNKRGVHIWGEGQQIDMFVDFNGLPDEKAKTQFYQHDAHWANRIILLAAVKKRGKLADIDDGKRPSILVNKKGGSLRPPFCCNKRMSEWLLVLTRDICSMQVIERANTTLFAHQLHNR